MPTVGYRHAIAPAQGEPYIHGQPLVVTYIIGIISEISSAPRIRAGPGGGLAALWQRWESPPYNNSRGFDTAASKQEAETRVCERAATLWGGVCLGLTTTQRHREGVVWGERGRGHGPHAATGCEI